MKDAGVGICEANSGSSGMVTRSSGGDGVARGTTEAHVEKPEDEVAAGDAT